MCVPRKLRIWKDKPQLGILRDTKEMPPFIFLLRCWAFWKGLSVLLQRIWSRLGVWIVVFSPVEWILLWVSVKLWGVNRLLEEPSHQVEGVRFWSLAAVQVYFLSVSGPHLPPLTWTGNSSYPFYYLFWSYILALCSFGGSLSFSCLKRLGIDEKTCHVQILGTLDLLLGWTRTGRTLTAMAK